MVRIRPRLCGSMLGRTVWVTRSVARQLMLIMLVYSGRGVSVKGTGMLCDCPTLLIRIEIFLDCRSCDRDV